ncbi:MAG: DnaJ domain-containing protein [Desulfobacteraceae bacterium]|jgi:DnaJ-class molecular chaperone
MQDYYVVLGIGKGASLEKIKKAYRSVVKKHHPDVTPSQESKERFLKIREAYEILSDETKRRQYDAALEREGSSLRGRHKPEIVRARNAQWNEMEDRFFSSTDEFLEGFLPGFFDPGPRRGQAKDLYYEAILTPMEAARGGLFPIPIPVLEPCPRCGKSGVWEDLFCPVCRGYGRVRREREITLSIPPNVTHGTKITVSLEDIGLRDVDLNMVFYIGSD